MSELDVQLRQSLERLVRHATDAPLDWDDVNRRARSGRTRGSILAGAALVCLVVGVAAGFGVGPGLWRLVAGTPVSPDRLSPEEKQMFASMSSGKPVLRTEPDSPEIKRLKGKVSIRLLATRGGHTFYVIDVHGPRVTQCLAIGRVGRPELFGALGCSSGDDFPSPDRPIADYSTFYGRPNGVVQIGRLEGFAADAVAKVGLLDEDGKLVAPVPVIDNTYLRTTGFPTGPLQAIVAYDQTGKRVYCEDIGRPLPGGKDRDAHPCGARGISPIPRRTEPMPPPSPPPTKLGRHLQHGSAGGVTVDVYEPGKAVFDLDGIDPAARRLITGPGGLSLGCMRVRFYQGRWLADDYSAGARFSGRLGWDFAGSRFDATDQLPPPYDGCEIGGFYGHRWNDAFGTRAVVEIPLTKEGRHFFNDRATARDLAYFARSGRVQRIRLSADPRPGLEAFVHRFPRRVEELASPGTTAPEHTIGFWIGDRTIVFTATSSTGRRFFVVAKRGTLKLPEKNLGDLAFVF